MTDHAHPANYEGETIPAAISKRDRAKFLTQELKSRVGSLLHHDDRRSSDLQRDFFEDAAFDPQRALQPTEPVKPSMGDRLSLGARTVANTLKNPKAVGRNNYTRHAVAKIANHPHDQSNDFDNELLDAHDDLTEAQSKFTSQDGDQLSRDSKCASNMASAQSRVELIEQQRDDLKTGWTLGRQIVRVKAVRHTRTKPDRSQFLVPPDTDPMNQHLQIGPYLGQMFLWYTDSFTAHRIDDYDAPPFDLPELALTVERVAAVSSPWQTFLFELREVYLWRDHRRTAGYMVAYWTLWYFQQLVTFGIAVAIYRTIRNKFDPNTVQSVRDRVRRSTEASAKVRAWGELVQRHGGSDWVEPLLDGIGPHLQMQLGDLSIFFERVQNFYRWEEPRQTWLTLFMFSTALLFLLLASTELCVRFLWFGLGCWFFYGFPIATHYPRYRHVVSPVSWIFWLIPDAAELAIMQLQEKVNAKDDDRASPPELDPERYPAGSDDQLVHNHINHENPGSEETNSFEEPDVERSPKILNSFPRARLSDRLEFKTILLPAHVSGTVILTRTHLEFYLEKGPSLSYPYTSILEMIKINLNKETDQSTTKSGTNKLSRTAHMSRSLEKSANVQISPDGLGFVFLQKDITPAEPPIYGPPEMPRQLRSDGGGNRGSRDADDKQKMSITLILNKSDRDKIFTVVLAWSGMQWQPLYSMNRQNKLGTRRKGTGKAETAEGGDDMNGNLDDAIKRALV